MKCLGSVVGLSYEPVELMTRVRIPAKASPSIKMAKKIDLQKHTLIPKHSKLTEKEAKEFLNSYNISTLQLPRILIKDPLVKQLDAKVGDILKFALHVIE